jgi:pilus assembly protein FimV
MSFKQPLIKCLLVLACSQAEALALSEASIHSHLGEPLAASLAISDDRPLVAQQLRVRFGTREESAAAGIDSGNLPTDATLAVEQNGPQLEVHITTENSISQPFIDFLLVVESPEVRLQRQYTLLVDLPN